METMTAQEFWDTLLKECPLKQIIITVEDKYSNAVFERKYIVRNKKFDKNLLWVYKDNSDFYWFTDFIESYQQHNLSSEETKNLYQKVDTMYYEQFKPDYLYTGLCNCETEQEMQSLIANKRKNLNAQNDCGDTVLCIAAREGKLKVVKALITAGANLNHQNNDECSPIMLAAHNRHNEVVKALADAGSDLDLTDKYNRTVLMIAAKHKNLELLQTLIDVIKVKKAKQENKKMQKPSMTITVMPLSLNEKNEVSVNGQVQSNNKINEATKPSDNGEKALQKMLAEKKNNLTRGWTDNWADTYGF